MYSGTWQLFSSERAWEPIRPQFITSRKALLLITSLPLQGKISRDLQPTSFCYTVLYFPNND